jgi:hypothetical protein
VHCAAEAQGMMHTCLCFSLFGLYPVFHKPAPGSHQAGDVC